MINISWYELRTRKENEELVRWAYAHGYRCLDPELGHGCIIRDAQTVLDRFQNLELTEWEEL